MRHPRFPVVWLTGNSGAGKTTVAFGLKAIYDRMEGSPIYRRIIVLDGDEMRASISEKETFSKESRRNHNLRVSRLASVLREQGFLVVVAVIAPFSDVRRDVDAICSPAWIYVSRSSPACVDQPYEPPESPFAIIDHDLLDHEQSLAHAQKILERLLSSADA